VVNKKDINIDEDSDGDHHNIGLNYDHLGKFEKAIEAYKKAIKIDPDSDGAHHNIGLCPLAKFRLSLHRQLFDCQTQIPLFGKKYDYCF
jgi:tetratricopeptide (TPR) repeat protein